GVARSWIYPLLQRYRAEGEAAFEPRSRRPRSSPAAISADTAGLIVRLRKACTTRLSGGRGGRNALEHELRHLGITQKNGRPNHPKPQGKVERLWHPSRKGCPPSPASPPRWPTCRPCPARSPPTTTPSGRTDPCGARPPRPPATLPGPKPH